MRTQGAFYADTGHQGGWIVYAATEIPSFSASLVLTRNALGDYSLNRTATGAETYRPAINLQATKRLLEVSTAPLPFQEQFGVAAGTAGYPAGAPGLPPFTGATQLTQPTAQPAKGVRVTDVMAVYQVGVADLTSASLSLNRVVYANNVAVAVTNMPISATALGLTAAGDATGPYVAVRAVTTPVYETTDLSDVILEATFVMGNNGTLRVYALGFHVDFNYD